MELRTIWEIFLSAYPLRGVSHNVVSVSVTNAQPWRQSGATDHRGAQVSTPAVVAWWPSKWQELSREHTLGHGRQCHIWGFE